MKIKIVSARLTCFFNMEWHPSFAGEVRYFIMYKKTLVAKIQIPERLVRYSHEV